MSAWNGVYEIADDDDPHADCDKCGDEHPVNVLEGGLCPCCVDDDDYDWASPTDMGAQ